MQLTININGLSLKLDISKSSNELEKKASNIATDDVVAPLAPTDPFLDRDKMVKKFGGGMGALVDGEYFKDSPDGVRAAKMRLKKKMRLDYFDHPDVIEALKLNGKG